MKTQVFLCSICQEPLEGRWANNAQPINDGECCNMCDANIVLPARLKRLQLGVSLRDTRAKSIA